jgi:lipid-binding SYLF domain-containing protein
VVATLIVILGTLSACATTSEEGGEPTRDALDAMADSAITRLLEEQPDTRELVEDALGWAVVDMRVAKIPFFGSGKGYGVVLDKHEGQRSYVRVSRFEIGGGIGAQKYKVVILFEESDLIARAARGTWHFEVGADVAAGSNAAGGDVKSGEGYHAFRLFESGAAATVTVRLARARPYLPD